MFYFYDVLGEAASVNEEMGCLNTGDNSTHSLASIQEVMDLPKHEGHPTSILDSAPETHSENITGTEESKGTCENAEDL